tara:strand:+ start:2016 stop:3167 length:1152 start_codon:yes stop_codon:yes gene_type:complete
MAKINVRSPYFAQVGVAGLTSATLEMLIYTGLANTTWQGSPQYTLSSTSTTGKLSFEISELIRDYIPAAFDGVYPSTNGSNTDNTTVYVDYKITPFTGTTAGTAVESFGNRAFYGYGYFEDGSSPQFLQGYLQSNTTILKPDDNPLRVPVDNENTNSVTFFNKGEQIYSWTPTIGLKIQDQISYVSTASADIDNYRDRVEDSGGTFEDNTCIQQFLRNETIYPVDEVIVNAVEGIKVLKIQNIEECKYTPYKVTFINKYGVYQDLWFFKKSNLSMTRKGEMFKSNLIGTYGSSGYATNRHQYSTFHVNGKEKLSLNTGFYPESYNEVFRQMSLSDKIWIKYNEKTLPVRLMSSSLAFKTKLDDKLINYKIELEFAFDKINNVR